MQYRRCGHAPGTTHPEDRAVIGPDIIAVALEHPDGPHTPRGAAYRRLGWLRCPTETILGLWTPAYAPLTHAAAGLDLPDPVGMHPAHYAVRLQVHTTGPARTLLRLGPYTQTGHASRDADRLTTLLAEQTPTTPGSRITATTTPYDPNRHTTYTDPYGDDDGHGSLLREAASRAVQARTPGAGEQGEAAR
ncbi:hypothetical protein ACIQIG_33760 [Streptomyces bacillaris]|uniref:hypothetical protein n=1 Tax=Streptomyces bacillaris TaxID=68179 RepID=UPI00345F710B